MILPLDYLSAPKLCELHRKSGQETDLRRNSCRTDYLLVFIRVGGLFKRGTLFFDDRALPCGLRMTELINTELKGTPELSNMRNCHDSAFGLSALKIVRIAQQKWTRN